MAGKEEEADSSSPLPSEIAVPDDAKKASEEAEIGERIARNIFGGVASAVLTPSASRPAVRYPSLAGDSSLSLVSSAKHLGYANVDFYISQLMLLPRMSDDQRTLIMRRAAQFMSKTGIPAALLQEGLIRLVTHVQRSQADPHTTYVRLPEYIYALVNGGQVRTSLMCNYGGRPEDAISDPSSPSLLLDRRSRDSDWPVVFWPSLGYAGSVLDAMVTVFVPASVDRRDVEYTELSVPGRLYMDATMDGAHGARSGAVFIGYPSDGRSSLLVINARLRDSPVWGRLTIGSTIVTLSRFTGMPLSTESGSAALAVQVATGVGVGADQSLVFQETYGPLLAGAAAIMNICRARQLVRGRYRDDLAVYVTRTVIGSVGINTVIFAQSMFDAARAIMRQRAPKEYLELAKPHPGMRARVGGEANATEWLDAGVNLLVLFFLLHVRDGAMPDEIRDLGAILDKWPLPGDADIDRDVGATLYDDLMEAATQSTNGFLAALKQLELKTKLAERILFEPSSSSADVE